MVTSPTHSWIEANDFNAQGPEAWYLPGGGQGLERPRGHRPDHLPRTRRLDVDPPVEPARHPGNPHRDRTSRPVALCTSTTTTTIARRICFGAVLADSAGRIRMNFTVPSNAEIDEEQDIIAKSSAANRSSSTRPRPTHSLPEQDLIVTPPGGFRRRARQDRGPQHAPLHPRVA